MLSKQTVFSRVIVPRFDRESYTLHYTLQDISNSPERWHEAHDIFSRIRAEISIPLQAEGALPIERNFALVAELVAKTLYNCSGENAPFDANSFKKLIRAEQTLLQDEEHGSIQDNMGLGRGTPPKSLSGGIAQIILGWFEPTR